MHVHIGGGIIILTLLGIIGIILAVGYVVRSSRRPVGQNNATGTYTPVGGGYQGYPGDRAGGAYPPSYVPPDRVVSTGEALVGSMIAGALIESALTPRTTIIENNDYVEGAMPVHEIVEVAPSGDGGFWSLDVTDDGDNNNNNNDDGNDE